MEAHGEVGILEQVSSQNQDNGFIRLHKSLLQQFLQPGKRNRGGRLAANTFGSDFGLGLRDLEFAHLFTSAASGLKNLDSFFPGSRVADADRCGSSLSLHADEMLAITFAQSANQCV